MVQTSGAVVGEVMKERRRRERERLINLSRFSSIYGRTHNLLR